MLVYQKNILTGRDFVRALCRRWKLVAAIFIVTAGAAGWSAFTTPATYRATAKVLLRRDERPTALNQFYSRLTQEEEIKSELEIANSRPVLMSVLRQLHAAEESTAAPAHFADTADTASAFETLAEEFRRHLTIEAVTGANVIAISYDDPLPSRASWCANALAQAYTAYNARVYSSEGANDFLSERIQQTRLRLDSLETLLATFRGANGMISVDKQENLFLEKYKSFDLQLAQMQERRQVLAGRIAQFRQLESAGDSMQVPTAEMDTHPAIRQLYSKLTDLRLQRRVLLEKYQPGHPLVEEVAQQLRSVNEELSSEIMRLRRLEEERLSAVTLEANALSGIVAGLHTNMEQLPEKKRTLEDLELARDQARKLYNVLVTRQGELGVENATDQRLSRVAVINPAGVPVQPLSRSKARTILLGVVLGLAAGIAAALLREFFDRTIKSPQELNSTLEIPVLASISESASQPRVDQWHSLTPGRVPPQLSKKINPPDKRREVASGKNTNRDQREYFIK